MNMAVWDRIEATLDRAAALSERNEKKIGILEMTVDKTSRAVDSLITERKEADKKRDEEIAELKKLTEHVNSEVKGIAKSNKMVSEDYFYNTLSESMVFGGNHFDSVDENIRRRCRGKDGKTVETEYDVLMINDAAVCIVEVKYRARKENIDELMEKVGKFRVQFPIYANHKIFLGIGAMSFEKGVAEAAKKRGMGILTLKGDALVVDDKDLKVY